MNQKSQVSTEYMLIIGFATVISIPLLLIYYNYTSDSRDSVASNQAIQIARNVVDASESVYYLGKPSQTVLKINMPENVKLVNISNKEIVFKIKTKNGLNDVFQVSSVNIRGSIPSSPGIHRLTLIAQDGYVQITSN